MTASSSSNDQLIEKLRNFTTRHTAHHVPLALVTSGGTAAPLERNCVRFLDNFSTGTRGAHAVEELCQRGYAVLHLKREGSVAPFGRILGQALQCGRGGPTFASFGALFDCAAGAGSEGEEEEEEEDDGLQDIDEDVEVEGQTTPKVGSVDPWMYSRSEERDSSDPATTSTSRSKRRGELALNRRLVNSPLLQATLRNYAQIKRQGLLLTIDFQTVEDYLHKLQLCSEAVHICGSLALVYLAAAVSDFYIPEEKQAVHKIQSRDYGITSHATPAAGGRKSDTTAGDAMQLHADNTLTLTLYPVPKVIPALRQQWCPNAFVVSFKLETDPLLLQRKSVLALERNDVHLVIGNELATRYEKVFLLSRQDDCCLEAANGDAPGSGTGTEAPEGYRIVEVTAAQGRAIASPATSGADALEYATIERVVQRHFYYISTHVNGGARDVPATTMASAAATTTRHTLRAAALHEERLNETHRTLQRERLKAQAAELAWNVAGSALGLALSYGITRILQGRQHGMTS